MNQLEDLLQQCTVKLTIPGRGGWGTGFFVAPGWMLTCAHVVQEAKVEPVQVWQQQENWAQAIVEKVLPDPYDLALLRVVIPDEVNPTCVYLDEEVKSRDPLYLFGYPDEGDRQGEPRTFNCDGITGSGIASILFNLGQVRPGMSGSPLLNQRTGKVCGIVKFTRDRSTDLGGGAIPSRVILEQFPQLRERQHQFHQSDRRWTDLLPLQMGPGRTLDAKTVEPYLRSLINDKRYQQKWGFYTPTDAIGKLQAPEIASELNIGLMAQLMQSKQVENNQNLKQREQENIEQLPVVEGIRRYAAEHVLLMGRPGSGKSTALLRLLIDEAKKALNDTSAKIPVLVELRYLDAERPSLIERISAFLHSHNLSLGETTLTTALIEGRFLLLFDGVNELPSEVARRSVARFRQDYTKTPMIFTTRDVAIGGDVGLERKLEMQPLDETQMRQFVQAYLPDQWEAMLQQLQGRLREIGQTPLLMWMLCDVFKGLKQLPSSLGLLFRWFVGEYDKLKQDVPTSEGLRYWQSELLQHLAFTMMQSEEPTELRVTISQQEAETVLAEFLNGKVNYPAQRAKEWLEDLLEHHLLQSPSPKQLEFHHQLLQEYYAAEALLHRLPRLSSKQLQQKYLNYLKWTEPAALMLSLINEQVEAERVVKIALDTDLKLGARLAKAANHQLRPRTLALINNLKVSLWLKAQLLSLASLEYSALSLEYKLANRAESSHRSITNLETIVSNINFIDIVKNLSNENDRERWDAAGQLEAFIYYFVTIIKILTQTSPELFQSVDDALEKIEKSELVFDLIEALKAKDFWVRSISAESLGKLGSNKAVSPLLVNLKDRNSYVRKTVADALGKIGSKKAIDGLLYALNDQEPMVRASAANALGKIGGQETVNKLDKLLANEDSWIRMRATDALGRTGATISISPLIKALNDKDIDVRRLAATSLGKIGTKAAIQPLIQALADQDFSVRRSAVDALGEFRTEEVIDSLLNTLKYDKNSFVIERIVQVLQENLNQENFVEKILLFKEKELTFQGVNTNILNRLQYEIEDIELIEIRNKLSNWDNEDVEDFEFFGGVDEQLTILQDKSLKFRAIVAESLGRIGGETAVAGLLEALQDNDYNVYWAAAEALGRIGSETAVAGLLEALQDKSFEVRWAVTKALGRIGGETAVAGLLEASQDKSFEVRWAAAEALGRIGDYTLISQLWQLCSAGKVELLSSIAAIQNRCKFYNHEIAQACCSHLDEGVCP
ncbi:HEAT repeat domain-containing protein [Trichocoleus sp. FACHB-262]|uniref:HEAT repeat domain-containing protein n=1 Tax=Trichocoleus sp. FACHB-262 TaxID=2692869 RepID=UPI0016855CE5|nr:HEAT repeat domain-containing protein [Trichocoleus sp. FACHB-262]MBD2122350.1 HEAT repeat domain-containing protein [Trichocoleus sp. FACHB-262]